MNQKYYTPKEAAALLGVTKSRIYAMLKQDSSPNRHKTHFPNAIKEVSKYVWRIPEEDIKEK